MKPRCPVCKKNQAKTAKVLDDGRTVIYMTACRACDRKLDQVRELLYPVVAP